jgi:hypothetical protein
MKALARDIQLRFHFIDRTLTHAIRACQTEAGIPTELKDFIRQLDQQSGHAKEALRSKKINQFRQSVDDMAELSDHMQRTISRPSNVNYQVKSAVILAHLEIAALKYQVH